jgi:uncharacterized protein YbjQ (UPF0145 family)
LVEKGGVKVAVDVTHDGKELEQLLSQGFTIVGEIVQALRASDVENGLSHEEAKEQRVREIASAVKTSTTHSIGGVEIVEHGGVITTTIIAGANIFRDIAAGVRDMVGGKSKAYMNKMKEIKQEAIDELKYDAASEGYNAIVGLTIDSEEVTAKGGSMLMVTVTGTTVLVK